MTQKELLKATLIQPTARLSEADAVERVESIRNAEHVLGITSGNSAEEVMPHGEEFREWRSDWQRMFVREDQA